jgi:hypothetical protein
MNEYFKLIKIKVFIHLILINQFIIIMDFK